MAVRKKSVKRPKRSGLHVRAGAGRAYEMGPLRAVFKADCGETADRYSISEWWLEPKTKGPGLHEHDEDDVFYVLEGTMSIALDEGSGVRWIDAKKGDLVVAPGGVRHDFENRTSKRAGVLNVSAPGGFEPHMEGIADWFRARSPAEARTAPRAERPPKATKRTRAR